MNRMGWNLLLLLLPCVAVHAFTTHNVQLPRSLPTLTRRLFGLLNDENSLEESIRRQAEYQPGAADTEFAQRFRHLQGKPIKTVGEAFADFTHILGSPINALYKNIMTDIVGTTHLTVVNARFERDEIWSLGMVTALQLLLKNYPDPDFAQKMISALFQCVQIPQEQVYSQAKMLEQWAQGKSTADIALALQAKDGDDSPLAKIARKIKSNPYWMYSRFFGIGLVKLMDMAGVEMSADEVYPVMEEWMSTHLGKSHFTACSDSDTYFKIKDKLDMMETMMKEIEIREKKRMAQRLEEKAEAVLRKAERDAQMAKEVALEKKE